MSHKNLEQFSLFQEAKPKEVAASVKPTPIKKPFTPPTLHNGLDPHKAKDHAMLWIRMLTKSGRNHADSFLYYQHKEMDFKRSEFDPLLIVRQCLVRNLSSK